MTKLEKLIEELKKCSLYKGSMIETAVKGGWMNEITAQQRAESAKIIASDKYATREEKEWALCFMQNGY